MKNYIAIAGKRVMGIMGRSAGGTEFGVFEDEVLGLIEERRSLKDEIKKRETLLTLCEDKLKAFIGENEELVVRDRVVTFKRYIRKVVNLASLREESPEVYERHLREHSYRRLEIR